MKYVLPNTYNNNTLCIQFGFDIFMTLVKLRCIFYFYGSTNILIPGEFAFYQSNHKFNHLKIGEIYMLSI